MLKEQYKLSAESNINISESDLLPDFEREIYINFLIEDLKRKNDGLRK